MGFLGLSVAADVQNAIHDMTGSDEAQGWRHQVSAGGEPTFKYSMTLQHHFDTRRDNLQITSAAGFSLGYLTEGILGISLRTGLIRTPAWSFNVPNSNYGAKANVVVPTSSSLTELYLIAGANLKLRAYNAFLQGQFRDSDLTYSSSQTEPLVYEGWLGLSCEFTSGFRLSYLLRHQSSELKESLADRSFTYAEFLVSYKL